MGVKRGPNGANLSFASAAAGILTRSPNPRNDLPWGPAPYPTNSDGRRFSFPGPLNETRTLSIIGTST